MGLFVFLGRVIGLLFRFVRAVLPYVVRIALEALKLAALSIVATFSGWPGTAKKLTDEMTSNFMRRGILPHTFENQVWWTFHITVWLHLIIGWIIAAHITVWLFRMIF